MSTQRYLNTGFWSDEYIEDLDPLEKYLYIYLLTNPMTNIAGIYQISMKRVAYETGLDKDTIIKMILRFTEHNKIAYIDNHIVIKNFIKHQKPTPNIQKGIDKILDVISDNIKEWLCNGKALEGIESHRKALNYINKNSNSNSNIKEPKKKKSKPFIPPTIEELNKYTKDEGLTFDTNKFIKYYQATGWKDKTGKDVKNWKLKAINWHSDDYQSPKQPYKQQTGVQQINDPDLVARTKVITSASKAQGVKQ